MTRMWKPKVHSIPNSSLVNKEGSLSAPGEQAGWLPRKQPVLLISPPGLLTTFLSSTCATYLGKLASLPDWPVAPVTQARIWQGTMLSAVFLPPRRLTPSHTRDVVREVHAPLFLSHYCLLPEVVNQRSLAPWVMESCCWVYVAPAQ